MSKPYAIVIPQLGVNDEFVEMIEWYVEDKSYVEVGAPICCVETSKVAVDLEAERDGYLFIRASVSEEIKIGQEIIGYIADSPDAEIVEEPQEVTPSETEEKTAELLLAEKKTTPQVKATAKAQELAQRYGIELEHISISGIIREKDVEGLIGERHMTRHATEPSEIAPIAIYGAGLGGRNARECVMIEKKYSVSYFIDVIILECINFK